MGRRNQARIGCPEGHAQSRKIGQVEARVLSLDRKHVLQDRPSQRIKGVAEALDVPAPGVRIIAQVRREVPLDQIVAFLQARHIHRLVGGHEGESGGGPAQALPVGGGTRILFPAAVLKDDVVLLEQRLGDFVGKVLVPRGSPVAHVIGHGDIHGGCVQSQTLDIGSAPHIESKELLNGLAGGLSIFVVAGGQI